jgi:hypothetical protein
MTLTRKILHVGATALMLSTVASITTFVTADTAYAERGGNGKGNGNGRANRDDRNRGQERQEARRQIMEDAGVDNWGAIASELGELNKANANINARLNSSDPVHQALGAYELSGGISVAGITAYNTALTGYETLLGTIGDPVLDPVTGLQVVAEDGTPVVVTEADIGTLEDYLAAELSPELIAAYESFAVINETRDEPLTRGALDAINYMLGLSAPVSE